MKNNTIIPKPWLFMIFLLAISFDSQCLQAQVRTYEITTNPPIPERYSHYSIEQIPGSNPAEFMAVGTARYPSGVVLGYFGFHVMRVDANGQVMNSKQYWVPYHTSNPRVSYEAVDITPEYDVNGNFTDHFWITAQARELGAGGGYVSDYIYVHKVHKTCVDAVPAAYTYIKSATTQPEYKNLYPANSLCYNGALFICGFASDIETSEPGDRPYNDLTDKIGMLVKYDFTNSGALTWYLWDSGDPISSNADYDMALKLRLAKGNASKPDRILLTGAVNTSMDCPSGILTIKFDPTTLIITNFNSVIPINYYVCWQPPKINGVFGIDIYEDENDDVYVLANYHNNDTGYSWGIVRLRPDLTAYPFGTNSYIGAQNGKNTWAKHFFYEEGPAVNDEGPRFRVVGEQAAAYCTTTEDDINMYHPGSLIPSYSNLNPFVAHVSTQWDASGLNGTIDWQKLHLSSTGTGIYYSGFPHYNPPAANVFMQDEKRLHTFATQIDEDPAKDIVIMAPIHYKEHAVKFVRVDNNGNENTCNNYVEECTDHFLSNTTNAALFQSIAYDMIKNEGTPYEDVNTTITEYDCASGVYKPSSVSGMVSDAGKIFVFPNPTEGRVNIRFENDVTDFTLSLNDVTGKQVYYQEAEVSKNEVEINLPDLSSGMYLLNIKTNNAVHTQKLMVK